MKPINFPEANCTLLGNGTTVSDMAIYTDGRACVSIWELTDEDIEEIVRTRRIYATVFHEPKGFPPIAIHADNNIPRQLNLFKA